MKNKKIKLKNDDKQKYFQHFYTQKIWAILSFLS